MEITVSHDGSKRGEFNVAHIFGLIYLLEGDGYKLSYSWRDDIPNGELVVRTNDPELAKLVKGMGETMNNNNVSGITAGLKCDADLGKFTRLGPMGVVASRLRGVLAQIKDTK